MFTDLYLNSRLCKSRMPNDQAAQHAAVLHEMDKLATMTDKDWYLVHESTYKGIRVLSMLDGALFACLGMAAAELGPELIKKVKKQKKIKSEGGGA